MDYSFYITSSISLLFQREFKKINVQDGILASIKREFCTAVYTIVIIHNYDLYYAMNNAT